MKISVNWLKEFVPSLSFDCSGLVDYLTFLGLEVEDVFEQKLPDQKVIVGKIVEVRPHPNADRLRICMVDTGEGELRQIVCGAPNVEAGMMVPVATIGAVLTAVSGETFTIKPAKIRGEHSSGMICAADELGLSDDHDGVMVLDEACEIGQPLARYLETDTVLDIAVTPNRPDALSHLGVARELADCNEIVYPQAPVIEFTRGGGLIEVQDEESCPYYTATVIKGVTVGPSPRWLARRLEQIGLRPKNNIVDITNYILHSFGQPLHAFDYHQLAGSRIVVRSDAESSFMALNKVEYQLQPGMTVVCDAREPVAIGGVMGGLHSAVTDKTTDILLEAAYFNPASVRKTAKQLQLSSDSSYRFERGVDPCNVKRAAEYAIAMILEIAGGNVDSAEAWGDMPAAQKIVSLRPKRVNAVLGSSITASRMVRLLEKICIKAVSQEAVSDDVDSIAFSVPSFRVDIEQEIDLIEEVARLYGYNNLEPAPVMVSSYPVSRKVPEYFPDYLRSIMIGLNFREVLTNPLIRKAEADCFSSMLVNVLNPISEELEVLRPNLAPSLLKVVGYNMRHGNRELRLFEVAHGFEKQPEAGRGNEGPLSAFLEKELLSMVITGRREPRSWNRQDENVDFYDLRGVVEMLLEKLNLLEKSAFNIYNARTIGIEITSTENGKTSVLKAGTVQQVNREVLDVFGLDQDVYLAELDVTLLERCFESGVIYEPPSKFPVVERDLSFVLPRHIPAQRLIDLAKASDPRVRSVRIFDVFDRGTTQGEPSTRSVALSLELADRSGTMNEEAISAVISKVIDNARSELGAVIRQV
ncbi:MAG TPA: phenylalanine--tRNA ligase subunit beta [Chlorobaculum sp.]|uniref:Phenylalanine--tRNA ligase beta subunit n=1 Tax=Chlorobaculum tepidum (strain ATCC 49652 / DSM 12025 / NBRC 103806 / TLS) TaxID=194439 RepID=SYFB_CHLTE|nr:phenylalanine--tRNA ligase subunit beta [Chlorobaculum tepidum]Q8KEF9.1 RecName: Full=Phenylalanine--tRNA ligase beta subunit; AltName: Full=Phenylalanyl-tRNA synthetase beta subunit; Short=PheRS [Chlorobaculum tepidum TLS]AAM71967.1 phenylalanyl-tRNA synthetase, beta subunit [Chlorobaculum tepidum TLS]HBU22887.1 phenylalanine--tRNA ligase subunit beta [Chlorobaculum sp.]